MLDPSAVLRDQILMAKIVEPKRLPPERQHASADKEIAHRAAASSNHATISARSSGVTPVRLPGGMAWLRPA